MWDMRQTIIFVVIAIILVGGGVYLTKTGKVASPEEFDNTNQEQINMDGFKVEDLVVGTGAEAVDGKVVSVHYTGTLDDGSKFDSSLDRGTPFSFTLGAQQVIQGWDLGVKGMKVGGKRRLTIPAALGYGAAGYPPVIPQNATLHFDVELLEVK
jgi:FKBP-type peptidyl-prolyl cis-trans isomerase FkpA